MTPIRKAALAVILLAIPLAFGAAADEIRDGAAPTPDLPASLTAHAESVPDFTPPALERPYRLHWQQRLLAAQRAFQTRLARVVDPVETGSISAER